MKTSVSFLLSMLGLALLATSCTSPRKRWTVPSHMPDYKRLGDEASFKQMLKIAYPDLQERFYRRVADGVYFGFYFDPVAKRYLLLVYPETKYGGGSSVSITDRKTGKDTGAFLQVKPMTWETHEEYKIYEWPGILWLQPSGTRGSSTTSSFMPGNWWNLNVPETQIHISARIDRHRNSATDKEEAWFFEAELNEKTGKWDVTQKYHPSWP